MKFKKIIAGAFAVMMTVATAMSASAVINYTQNWNNGHGTSSLQDLGGGHYKATWTKSSGYSDFNCVIGAGCKPGAANKTIGYNLGQLTNSSGGGCIYWSLYGWTTNSLIEYYVMESYINYKPAEGTKLGTINSDGGTYDVWKHQQVNQPSISGTQTFWQIFSLRQSPVTAPSGSRTITFQNHVNGWKNMGFNLGSN